MSIIATQNILRLLKPIFQRWERLRIFYNIFLTTLVLFPTGLQFKLPDWSELLILLFGAALANVCYFAGPCGEAYIGWIGFRSRAITVVLFLLGILVSIPCVYIYGFSYVLMMN